MSEKQSVKTKLVIVGILFLVLLVGCAKKDTVATVGKESITTEDFKKAFSERFRGEENAKARTLDERKKFLSEMAIQLAKYQEAEARGIDKRPDVKDEIEKMAKRKALDILYNKKIMDAVVTDENAKKFYDMSANELKARHILLKVNPADSVNGGDAKVKARIDSIKKAIDKGLSFKVAAKMLSDDATSAADSGDLGWFPWGRMVDDFQEAAFKADLNKMIGPIKSPYGYHLIVVEEKRPVHDRRPFEESKQKIKDQLREVEGQKLGETARKYVENLRTKNKLEYNQPVLDAFRAKMMDPTTPKNNSVAPLFTEAEKNQTAASFKSGKITLAEMIEKLGTNAARVNWEDPQSIKDLVNAIVEPKFLDADAESQGYFKQAMNDPDIIDQKQAAIIRLLDKEEVTDKINPTEAEEKAYYQKFLANYIQPEMRTVREIFIKTDSTKAARVRDRAVKGENFKALAFRFNEKESTKADTGRMGPFELKRFGMIGKAAFDLQKVGDISTVQRLGDNFSILQLLSIAPSRTKTFEEAQKDVSREYRTAKTDEMQKALEKMCTDKFQLTIDEKKLSAVWPLISEAKVDPKKAREP